MINRSRYITLGLVVVVTLTLLNLPSQTTARLKLGIGSMFVPLFGWAGSVQHLSGKAGDSLMPRHELLKANETLRRDNDQMRFRSMQAEEIARENARLRDMFHWEHQTPWKLKLASVVLREPANWWHTVQIDLGSRDGVRVNLPVLTTEGLVGRVASVSLTRAQVVLLGDPNCHASALVENETRDTGVIGSSGPLDSALVEMGYLSRNANLKPGQNVVTSGLGGIFPKGIPIGKVVDSQTADYGLSTVARVKLAANPNALEEVWVFSHENPARYSRDNDSGQERIVRPELLADGDFNY